MNLKKIGLSIALIAMFLVIIFTQNVYATTLDQGQEIYYGIIELMTDDEPNMGYAINKPGDANSAKIWNIVKYKSATSDKFDDLNLYCVKAGLGFTQIENGNIKRAAYNVFFDMKTEREAIKAQNDTLKELVEKQITEDGVTFNRYDALLAVMDMLYLPKESTEAEKQELLKEIIDYAKKPESGYTSYVELMQSYPLTDSDINAVQQAVIWYFTNYGEENGKYDKTKANAWLNYTLDGTAYDNLANYTPNNLQPQYDAGQARSYQAEILYNYMIKKAKANANQYTDSSTTLGAPAKLNTTTLNSTENGDNYIVGPINITENEVSSIPYTIDFKVKNNGAEISDYKLLDENKEAVAEGTTVKDLVGKDFYISVPKAQATALSVNIAIKYNNTKMTLWASTTNNKEQPVVEVKKEPKVDEVELKLNPGKVFDLALRKYITKVNGVEIQQANTRVPNIDESTLESETTATYKHRKDPVTVVTGDKITYKLTIYNEGEKAGRATKLVDQLPTGLKFSKVISGNFELENYNEETNSLNLVRKVDNTENLNSYTKGNLDSETVEIECEVVAQADKATNKILTNVAWISEAFDAEDNTKEVKDRDSEPATKPEVNKDNMENYEGKENKEDLSDSNYYYKGQQDDDDFEKLVMLPESFDLKLIKRITAVNDKNVPERIEKIDVSKLNRLDENGNMATTADYQVNKQPVGVKKGDIVTYTFRIYNEGTVDGYAQELTEDVPEGLEFIWSEKEGEELQADTTLTAEEKEAVEFNQKYLWGKFVYDEAKERIIQISSDYLSKEQELTPNANLINAFGKNDGTKTEADLSYKEIAVKFKVTSNDTTGTIIRNEAAITEDVDKNGNPIDDRDSDTEIWKKYEDDEDYDNVILQSFDLSLRKFIVAVSKDEKIENEEYLKNEDGSYKRSPIVDTAKLNTVDENGKLITTSEYNHTKEPILVATNDIIVYMLRVYNEGEIDGYAAEIKDHLPPYLEFVDGEFNTQYGWKVAEDGRTVTTNYLEDNIIESAKKDENGKYVLSYKEVPIMCKVKENAQPNEKITNIADITKYLDESKETVNDRDSVQDNVKLPADKELPGYKDNETGKYIPGQEDDDDFEKVIVKEFDLALRKWVTQAIVIENGKETITNTGHQPYDDPEQVVKVELHRKKLDQVTVKFRYSIRIINEGDIEGYAKEITDYVPEGLKFVAEDNPGWIDEGNNVISTRLLENTLLKPGEYADVEVVLTWINSQDNMGVKTNIAEISEDYNEYDVPDKDSTPDNKKEGEDDIDDAPVMLTVSTGQMRIYFTLGFTILITIAGGLILIKKFVL